jgi:ankyrin repeat protein
MKKLLLSITVLLSVPMAYAMAPNKPRVLDLTDKERAAGIDLMVDCARAGDLQAVEYLLTAGINAEASDSEGETLLLVAKRLHNPRLIELLESNRANPFAMRSFSAVPDHSAAASAGAVAYEPASHVQAELPHQPRPEMLDDEVKLDSEEELSYAGRLDLARDAALTSSGADDGIVTALYALDYELVQGLLFSGVNVNTRNSHGSTLLHIAVSLGSSAFVRLLRTHGADIYAVDARGFTPMDLSEGRLRRMDEIGAGAPVFLILI